MKYSIEDTAVAIGLMANAGIKGSQAGTVLRLMLTRIVKPPEEVAEALSALNIPAKNSDGTMKPLSQTLNVRVSKSTSSEAITTTAQNTNSAIVYVTNIGEKYYGSNCSYLRKKIK